MKKTAKNMGCSNSSDTVAPKISIFQGSIITLAKFVVPTVISAQLKVFRKGHFHEAFKSQILEKKNPVR